MSDEGIKRIPIQEFADEGYLQEVNRVYLHPMGLALEWHPKGFDRDSLGDWFTERGVQFGTDALDNVWTFIRLMGLDEPRLGGVWDYRDDPEGIMFGWGDITDEMRSKADKVAAQWNRMKETRTEKLGFMVQPLNTQIIQVEGIKKLIDEVGTPGGEG